MKRDVLDVMEQVAENHNGALRGISNLPNQAKMNGAPPPPPNAFQQPAQPNAAEAARAALVGAQQAARQPNALLPPAIGAADPLLGVVAAQPRMMDYGFGGFHGQPPQRSFGMDALQFTANFQMQLTQAMLAGIETIAQRFLEASAAQDERNNAHVERIVRDGNDRLVAAFAAAAPVPAASAPVASAPSASVAMASSPAAAASSPAASASSTPAIISSGAAAPNLAAAVVAAPVAASTPMAASAPMAAPAQMAAPAAAAPVAGRNPIRRRNFHLPIGSTEPPITRRRAANRDGR